MSNKSWRRHPIQGAHCLVGRQGPRRPEPATAGAIVDGRAIPAFKLVERDMAQPVPAVDKPLTCIAKRFIFVEAALDRLTVRQDRHEVPAAGKPFTRAVIAAAVSV